MQGKFVLLFNKFRRQWEVPGGCLEENETLRQCVKRECLEEIGHPVQKPKFIGLMKFYLKGDGQNRNDRTEYGALYAADIEGEIAFTENEEMDALCLYETGMEIGYINEIDQKLLEYYRP